MRGPVSDENIKFKLDLDSAEFIEKGLQAKSTIQGIGSKENLSELLEGLSQTSVILGTVGVAAFSVKKAIDFTLEAESIRKVEKQFETLTEQAGISSETLKTGLEKASLGLVDTSDLLEVANKKIVAMGGSAEKLPAIMDLATKASQVYGGTVLENFDEISTAIANGNTRMLKHKGILVDSQKAVQDYAEANGIAVNEISEVGKRQAILNAALEQGNKAFAGVEVDMNSATNTLQLLKVTMKDLGEAFTLAFEKTMGPTVRSFLTAVKDMAAGVKENFQAAFGEGLEQNTAQIGLVDSKIKDLTATLEQLKAKQGTKFDFAPGDTAARIQGITESLKQNEAELGNLKKAREALTKSEKTGASESSALGKKGVAEDTVNMQVRAQNQAKYQAERSKLDTAALKLQQKNIKTLSDVDATVKAQRLARQGAHDAEIQQIQNQTFLNETEKQELIAKSNENYQTQLKIDEKETSKFRKQLLDDYVQNSTDAFDGIGRAFQSHSEQAKLDLTDMGKRGEEVFKSIQSQSVDAFEAMGSAIAQGKNIAEAAGQAILKIFLGVIADRAIAEGSMLLLTGIFPPNPLALGAGAGLIALGGALKSVAGSVGGGVSVPAGGASSSGGGSSASSMAKESTSTQIDIAKQKEDYALESSLRRKQLQDEQDASNQDILDKKDISESEKTDLLAKNKDLYDLKKQKLEGDLSEGFEKIQVSNNKDAVAAQKAQQKLDDQAQATQDRLDKEQEKRDQNLQKMLDAEDKNKATLAAAALKSQKDAEDKIAKEAAQAAKDEVKAQKEADRAASQAALQTSNSAINQDQKLADTATQSSQRQKVVQVHIAGNYLDTDQTRRQLMELIRQETDATAFEYKKIGV